MRRRCFRKYSSVWTGLVLFVILYFTVNWGGVYLNSVDRKEKYLKEVIQKSDKSRITDHSKAKAIQQSLLDDKDDETELKLLNNKNIKIEVGQQDPLDSIKRPSLDSSLIDWNSLVPKRGHCAWINHYQSTEDIPLGLGIVPVKAKNSSYDLNCIGRLLKSTEWVGNDTTRKRLRNNLEKYVKTKKMVALTQENLDARKRKVYFVFKRTVGLTVPHYVYRKLPEKSPFSKMYKTCAVVGSSGILINSSCGHNIDQNQFVFRCNAPPMSKFESDAGRKANFTTMNPSSIIKLKYKNLVWSKDKSRFVHDNRQYNGYLWIPAYAYPVTVLPSHQALSTMRRQKNVAVILGHPDHFVLLEEYWNKTFSIHKRLSTGLFVVSVALSLCEEVNVYGFWPFAINSKGNNVSYHYYDNAKITTNHDFYYEFELMLKMHLEGVIRLYFDNCGSND